MKHLTTVRALALIVLALLLSGVLAQSGVGFDILRWRATSGGISNGGRYKLGGTIGQHDAGQVRGGSFILRGGFRGGLGAQATPFPGAFLPFVSYPVSPTPTPTPSPTPKPIPDCGDKEPNYRPKDAKYLAVPFGQECSGTFLQSETALPDGRMLDIYRIALRDGQLIELRLSGIPVGSDNNLRLYNFGLWEGSDNALVCELNHSGNADEHAVCEVKRTEDHFIVVELVPQTSPNAYRLLVKLAN